MPETVAAAKTIGQVLWDDLNFEREFYLIPRDTYRSIPPADLDRSGCRSISGRSSAPTASSSARSARARPAYVVQVRLLEVVGGRVGARQGVQRVAQLGQGRRRSTRTRRRTRSISSSAGCAASRGPSCAFSSDRDGERMKGPVGDRDISNIYRSDYDGANQTRITVTAVARHHAGLGARRQPIAYTSWRSGYPDIIVQSMIDRDAAAEAGQGHRPRRRTTCRRGRPTARSSRSCRTATATRRSTS